MRDVLIHIHRCVCAQVNRLFVINNEADTGRLDNIVSHFCSVLTNEYPVKPKIAPNETVCRHFQLEVSS